jgi:hypothetical protein
MKTTLALFAVLATLAGAPQGAAALPKTAQAGVPEDTEEAAPPLPLPPPPPAVQPAPVYVPAPAQAHVVRAVPVMIVPNPAIDNNFRKTYKFGLGLDFMGPAYTIGLTAHWNVSSLLGLSGTFGFVGPQVVTLQARLTPVDGKWTPYVAGGVSFLLNPESHTDCGAWETNGAYECSEVKKGDGFLFPDTNVIGSLEVGAMVITRHGFSAQLGVTFLLSSHYKDEYNLLTVPWPKIGLSWYF